jgi:hypothetical protein
MPKLGEWFAAFRLHTLEVDRLAIEWREGDQPPFLGVLQGGARRDAEQLRTRWLLTEGGRPRYEFTLDLAADGTLSTALFPAAAPQEPLLRATITITPQGRDTIAVHGSVEAQFKPLVPLLAPLLALPPSVTGLDGQLRVSWRGTAPATLPTASEGLLHGSAVDGSVLLDASVARAGSILQDGRLHLDATFESRDSTLRWRVRNNLRLSAYLNPALFAITGNPDAPFVRTPKPLVIRAPRALSGELAIAPSEYRLTIAPQPLIVFEQLHVPAAEIASLTATLTRAARISFRPATGLWETGNLALTVTAPAIQPQYAAIGTIEDFTASAVLGASPLTRLPPLNINEAAATLLGGRVQTRGIRYDGRHDSQFAIDIAHLDLARVVALEQQQGIDASGLLDGSLPVTLTPRGLSIADGQLHARPPGGAIRYQGTDSVRNMAAANPNLKLVLNALGNYQYDKLNVGVDYAEAGDLVLQLALAGRNPDWNAGQPIHLNVSITENIPTLLRSLSLSEEISGKVEKRMQEQSRPSR